MKLAKSINLTGVPDLPCHLFLVARVSIYQRATKHVPQALPPDPLSHPRRLIRPLPKLQPLQPLASHPAWPHGEERIESNPGEWNRQWEPDIWETQRFAACCLFCFVFCCTSRGSWFGSIRSVSFQACLLDCSEQSIQVLRPTTWSRLAGWPGPFGDPKGVIGARSSGGSRRHGLQKLPRLQLLLHGTGFDKARATRSWRSCQSLCRGHGLWRSQAESQARKSAPPHDRPR